jgi:hypothetical protein
MALIQGTYNYIPEKNHASSIYNVAISFCLQRMQYSTCNVISNDKRFVFKLIIITIIIVVIL